MFDPTYPPTNALIESAPLRGQFNSLKALIDVLPTQAELANVLASTSNNSNTVGSIAMNLDPDYNQNQMQMIVDKLEELIQALRR
jgi:hypothetical protein